ncbi:hypothetical protein J3F84DRAFT_360815 [Trichoderma pleuroticola]
MRCRPGLAATLQRQQRRPSRLSVCLSACCRPAALSSVALLLLLPALLAACRLLLGLVRSTEGFDCYSRVCVCVCVCLASACVRVCVSAR